MSDLRVTDVNVESLLDKLRNLHWMIPKFQREFVWTTSDVVSLAHSILDKRPIGMITLWEQDEPSGLELDPISIPDNIDGEPSLRHFSNYTTVPSRRYAILDGRQRSTAIAMLFGSFWPRDKRYKHAGRYFLNLNEIDPSRRVVYVKHSLVESDKLDSEASCVARGFVPLSSGANESLMTQWIRYVRLIDNPEIYPDCTLPSEETRAERRKVLDNAFDGLVNTKLAVYEIPSTYDLGDICEIFETLNTTGTRVSTVDLVHSWLYSETHDQAPILLRDWINELGETKGAVGWASTDSRPELILQTATACYVAMDRKPAKPRLVGRKTGDIASIKAGDMLSVPTAHWEQVTTHRELLAEFLNDFQLATARGNFGWRQCPYPASACIYVGLRWHKHFDAIETWNQTELDALYRAFFWRNALKQRYDQGFLTQVGNDIKFLKSVLGMRESHSSTSEWISTIEPKLADHTGSIPTESDLSDYLTDGRIGGALRKALLLTMTAQVSADLFTSEPLAGTREIHHIYPRDWCRNNATGDDAEILRAESGMKDWVNAPANLMPLSRESNRLWKARSPGQMLREDEQLEFANLSHTLETLFIDQAAFETLASPVPQPRVFWEKRAKIMASHFIKLMSIST